MKLLSLERRPTPDRTHGRRSLLQAARLAISLAAGSLPFGCAAAAPKATAGDDARIDALTAGVANVKTSIDVQSNYGIGAIVTMTTALIVVSIALIVVSLIAKRLIGYIIRDRELDKSRNGNGECQKP